MADLRVDNCTRSHWSSGSNRSYWPRGSNIPVVAIVSVTPVAPIVSLRPTRACGTASYATVSKKRSQTLRITLLAQA
jgi:hypothetical protein